MSRRKTTRTKVSRTRRVWRTVKVTKSILQCERPYVLFGDAVCEQRHKLGMTQQELSEKLGYARASIANIETGRQRILLSDVFDFAKALKLKPQALFEAAAR